MPGNDLLISECFDSKIQTSTFKHKNLFDQFITFAIQLPGMCIVPVVPDKFVCVLKTYSSLGVYTKAFKHHTEYFQKYLVVPDCIFSFTLYVYNDCYIKISV